VAEEARFAALWFFFLSSFVVVVGFHAMKRGGFRLYGAGFWCRFVWLVLA
jgi:hypothetical protein